MTDLAFDGDGIEGLLEIGGVAHKPEVPASQDILDHNVCDGKDAEPGFPPLTGQGRVIQLGDDVWPNAFGVEPLLGRPFTVSMNSRPRAKISSA